MRAQIRSSLGRRSALPGAGRTRRRGSAARRPTRALGRFLVPLAAALLGTSSLAAQGPPTLDGERVVGLSFEGVQGVDPQALRTAIATEATRCRSVLYTITGLCWILDSPLFEHKPTLDTDELARDELRIRVFYFRRGWRDVEVRSEVVPAGEGVRVTFHVQEGAPTRISTVTVQQRGEELDSARLARLGLPAEGEPLDLTALDSLDARLRTTLWDRGYGDAVVRDTAIVDDGADVARLEIAIEPGARTTIARVDVEGHERLDERTVRRLVDLEDGQLFRRRDLLDAQRRLYRSELFRQAIIRVPEQADSAKAVEIAVREAPFRAVRLGIGFTTIEFGQAEARLTRYDWLGGARRLDLDAGVGNLLAPQLYGRALFGGAVPTGVGREVDDVYLQPTWRVSAQLTQPWLFSTRNALGVGVFARRRSVPGIVVDHGWGANASLTRTLDERVPVSLTYRFERTRVEAGQVYFCASFGVCRPETADAIAAAHHLSPLGLETHAELVDDALAPTRGLTARLALEHASSLTGSDFRYNRVAGELAYYWPVGRSTLAARVRGGWVRPLAGTFDALDLDDGGPGLLHPRKRFYAGGTNSVRGYAENQLGPRVLIVDPALLLEPADTTAVACTPATLESGTCDPGFVSSSEFRPRPLGGEALLEGGLELRFPLLPSMLGAVFVDAGHVVATDGSLAPSSSAITPGVGIRYQSPLGPIRVDLGVRPGLVQDLPVITQVGEGSEARLVVLDTRKRYDPLEGSGGFIRAFFSRLQLHLAIGEAF